MRVIEWWKDKGILDFNWWFSIEWEEVFINDPRWDDGKLKWTIKNSVWDVRSAVHQTLMPNLEIARNVNESNHVGIAFWRVNFFANDPGWNFWDYPNFTDFWYRPDSRRWNCPIIDPVNADLIDRQTDRRIPDNEFNRLYFLSVIWSDNTDHEYDPAKIKFYWPFIAFKLHMLHHLSKKSFFPTWKLDFEKGLENEIWKDVSVERKIDELRWKPRDFYEKILKEWTSKDLEIYFWLLRKRDWNDDIVSSYLAQKDIVNTFLSQRTIWERINWLLK